MKKQVLMCLLVLAMVLGFAGCTTAMDNLDTYVSLMGTQVSTLLNGGISGAEQTDERIQLDAPGNFTCDAAGNYSFEGVDNANYYVIYLYKNGSSTYDYVSDSITGSGAISGSIADLHYGFGDYEVTCVAYPDYTSETYRGSQASSATIKVTGEVEEPSLTFFWDCFANELHVIWLNSNAYDSTICPETMNITLSGEISKEFSLAMDASTTSYLLEGAEPGATYEVNATVTFDSNYVTNASFQQNLGTVTCDERANFAPAGYEYNSGLYQYADYPLSGENFDLTSGGEIGRWKVSHDSNAWMSVTSATAEYLIYTATPSETESDDAYTYAVVAANDDDSDVYSGSFGTMHDFGGTLHLYTDGTFKLELDATYICTDLISNAEQWHNGSYIEGCWYENGDGTVDLSYDLGSEIDLGKGVR